MMVNGYIVLDKNFTKIWNDLPVFAISPEHRNQMNVLRH